MSGKLCLVKGKEPFEYTLSVISGKWRLKIIYVLACTKIIRYGELKRNLMGITHKMLSAQLKDLETRGIVERKEYLQVPPKVEYSLSGKGQTLIPLMEAMCEWGTAYPASN